MASDFGYIDIGFTADADPDTLRERAVTRLATDIPGYVSAPGNPEVRILAETAEMAADREAVAIDVSRAVFRELARSLFRIEPIEATLASGATTWVFPDTAGYTIPYGTHISIAGEIFTVSLETVVAPGSTTATGVPIISALAGVARSGLSGTAKLEDAIPGSPTITVDGITTDGQDAEPQDGFEHRAARRIRTWGRPVRPEDVENLALEVVGVHRALAIDNYKPGPPYDAAAAATGVERMVTVAVVDAAGQPVSSGVKTVVMSDLQAEREWTFVFWVIDPTYTAVKVEAEIVPHDGYDAQTAVDDANAAIAAYINPATWGDRLFGERAGWHDEPVVYRGEIYTVLNNVESVRRVKPGTLQINDVDADLTLTGPAPLPTLNPASAITLAT